MKRANYRKEVRAFAKVMIDKLVENDYKGGWQFCSLGYLLSRLKEEVDEVEKALLKKSTTDEVAGECADVANMALMIADNFARRNHATYRSKV